MGKGQGPGDHRVAVILSIIAVIVTFGLVVCLHEFGHYLMCLVFGVHVERFAFGFGPELIGMTRNGTRFSVCAVPLGGFVKPAGENQDEFQGKPEEYFSKSWAQRFGIVAAGPVMNYVLAFLLFFGIIIVKGIPEASKEPVIGEVGETLPAAQAGLKAKDRVLKVNEQAVSSWQELADAIHAKPKQEVRLSIQRDEMTFDLKVVTMSNPATGEGMIGIVPVTVNQKVGLIGAAKESALQCWAYTKFTVTSLAQKIRRRERPDVAGPIGIMQMVSRAAHSGFDEFVGFIGLISVAIGFFNILPIPLMDGGHAALYLWEGLSRRKPSPKALNVINYAGICFLISLLLFATYNDFLRNREERRLRQQKPPQLEKSPQK